MYGPPLDPRDSFAPEQPTWRTIFTLYAITGLIPVPLWALSHPLTGAVVIGGALGLFVGTRRAVRLARCFVDCGGFAVDLGGRVRICITRSNCTDAA